jgi:hypothetical protein
MSKILVVQPDRMLQQAFMLALCPEHEVQMFPVLPDATPTSFDAAIIDVAALREYESLTAGDLRAIQTWQVPMVWIDSDVAALSADHRNALRLKRPVTKESLLKALAECLRPASITNGSQSSNPRIVKAPTKTKPKPRKSAASAPANNEGKFIELVDVVEEGTATGITVAQVKSRA